MSVRIPVAAAMLLLGAAGVARGEPYLAARMGFKCMQCHASPTGGGLRNAYGNTYAQTVMPARRLGKEEPWTGMLGRFIAIGGNLRADYDHVSVDGQQDDSEFAVEEGRLFLAAELIPGRLSIYVDEVVAPGNADNREAYARVWLRESALYLQAGRMYLPFGWRLEDDAAFVRQVSGIGMTTPDNGAEIGLESGPWTAQLAISNGSAGGPEEDTGKQLTLRTEYVQSAWRLGVSASSVDSDAGDRQVLGVHAALRTGSVVWLGEADYVEDDALGNAGRNLIAAFGEADWLLRPGHNLKLAAEWLDPDDDVDEDEQNRFSLVYELTPCEFLQLRLGARLYDGIPQNALQNREQYFVQLHGFF
jgi:hypothetical protein